MSPSDRALVMAGLNVRIDKEGKNLYFQNKSNFLANICLDADSLKIDRVFNIKKIRDLIKFEADCVGSEIVALDQSGLLKVSEKNMMYKMATESKLRKKSSIIYPKNSEILLIWQILKKIENQKFSAFTTTPDDKYLVSCGTTKDESKGLNETTIYSYKSKKGGVLVKMDEFKIKTHWEQGKLKPLNHTRGLRRPD